LSYGIVVNLSFVHIAAQNAHASYFVFYVWILQLVGVYYCTVLSCVAACCTVMCIKLWSLHLTVTNQPRC